MSIRWSAMPGDTYAAIPPGKQIQKAKLTPLLSQSKQAHHLRMTPATMKSKPSEGYWFSRGGMVFQANLQNPVPAYLRRGEIRAAIRGQYNACYYPSVNIFTEEYKQWRGPSGPFYKVPDEAKFVSRLREMLVLEHEGDLLLAAGTPRRWLSPGEKVTVTDAPTHYGPVSYTLEATEKEVRSAIHLPGRGAYGKAWIAVRLPETKWIVAVTVDGKPWREIDQASGRILLPRRSTSLLLVVRTEGARE